jgi:thiosulfate/3-mercaptopyruvate sulfurtransferase
VTRAELLVSVAELAPMLSRVRLLDVRWSLTDSPGDGRLRYAEGHLPGARFLDLEEVLTAHTGDPLDGRHPLPEVEPLAAGVSALGVSEQDEIVVYDEPGSFAAERAWWVLRWVGLRVRVLDGGLPAWVEAGRPLESGEPPPPPRRRWS